MTVFHLDEWQSGSGKWYCADTSNLGNNSGFWYHEAKIWNKSGDEFVKMLVEKYKCDYLSYNKESNMLLFAWTSQSAMRKYKNDTNARARKIQYII